ncbi:hypothetical protein [Micromonospora globispora]|nr:hypothetical protein [Micromonospora globispora]
MELADGTIDDHAMGLQGPKATSIVLAHRSAKHPVMAPLYVKTPLGGRV